MISAKQAYYLPLKYILPSLMLMALIAFQSIAQDVPEMIEQEQVQNNFDDQELQQFASAAGKVMVIQQDTEQKMIKAIEDENLEIEKFNEILQSQQSQDEEINATEDEMQSFNNAAEKIIQIQTEVQSDMMRAIQEEGLEPQKYEEILMAYQSDPELKARIDAILHNDVAE